MRYPFDATGTIGSRPCEVHLNQILAEKNDPRLSHKVIKLLIECRTHLKALKAITNDKIRNHFVKIYQEDLERRVEKITGTPPRGKKLTKEDVLTSHTMCCLKSYFSNFYDQYNEKVPSL